MRRRDFLALLSALPLSLPALAALRKDPRPLKRLLQYNAYPIDAETPLELLTDYLTPNPLFFIRHHWQPSPPDPTTWRLVVDGEVARPLSFSLAELRRLPRSSVTCVLQCAGNGRGFQTPAVPGIQWGQGALGNARWTGVRVRDLLQRAGLKASARYLHGFGTDTPPGKNVPPFHRSWELEKAEADALIAFEMNGAPLPVLHGAPARMVVPGWAGDHWMKWLARLSAQAEPQHGFYMDTAYRYPRTPGAPGVAVRPEDMTSLTELFVKSLFTLVPARARLGKPLTVRGLAFSGAPDIAKVDVSDDDGASWQPAKLDSRHDPYAWRLWSFRWTPAKPGQVTLLAKATDSRGSIQPRNPVWNPSGYLGNGWHTTTIEVTEDPTSLSSPSSLSSPLGRQIPPLPEGPGREAALQSCIQCHSSEMLRQQHLTERQWTANLAKMKGWGAELNDEAAARLLTYLSEHFGPSNTGFRPVPVRPNSR